MIILQMTSSSYPRGGRGGKGNSPSGRGFGGRILLSQISIDNDCFTMVTKHKRGGYIGSSSSSSQKAKQKEDISSKKNISQFMAKNDNSDYVSKTFFIHICYIE